MKLMLFFSLFCFVSISSFSQQAMLFIKKNGKKKKTYLEGEYIQLVTQNDGIKAGRISYLRDSLVFISGKPIAASSVKTILLGKKKKAFPANVKTILLISAGVALTTVGLSLNNYLPPKEAFLNAAIIGYGPILVTHVANRIGYLVRRKKYTIGKKFHLQLLDLRLPQTEAY